MNGCASFGIVPLGEKAIKFPEEITGVSVVLKEGKIEVTFPKPKVTFPKPKSPGSNTTLTVAFKVDAEKMTFTVKNGALLVNGSPAMLVQLRDQSGYQFEVYAMLPGWSKTIPGGLGLLCGILSTIVEQTYSIRGVVADEKGVNHPAKVTRTETFCPVPQHSEAIELYLRAGAEMKRPTFSALPNLWTRDSNLISGGRKVVLKGGRLEVA